MIKVAICGNIAGGKSEVEKILKRHGYPVMDTDEVSHKILENNPKIISEFSSCDIFDNGEISREKLGKIVFSDKDLKQKLEAIIHPEVKDKIIEFFTAHQGDKYAFVAIPLLFEAKMEELFDKIIFIYADDKIRMERLIKRNNYSKEYAKIRLNSQIPQEVKVQKSDYIIYNNKDLITLEKEILKLIE